MRKRFTIWWRAYTTGDKVWRIQFSNKTISKLLSYGEAKSYNKLFKRSKIFIDYSVNI